MTRDAHGPAAPLGPGAPPPAAAPPGLLERRAGLLCGALLSILFVQGLFFMTESSQTSDEAAHLAAGYSYLRSADFRLNPEHPPLIKELAALPLLALRLDFPWGPLWDQAEEWNIGRIFVHENRVRNDTLLFLGRLPNLLLSMALGWALFVFARSLFGAQGALLALSLWVLDPNVVAHSSLVTTDLGIALFIFLSVAAFRSWILRPSRLRLLLFGLAVGGAFASKFTAVWLPPILAALGLALLLLGEPLPRRLLAANAAGAGGPGGAGAARAPLRARLGILCGAALVVLGVAAAVVALTYLGVGLPAWRLGLERTLHHSAMGHRAYLMGRVSETGWWYYFPLAWLVKTPPGTILLVLGSLAAALAGRRLGRRDELFLYLPVAVMVAIMMTWKVNIGLRHLLPVYPFLYAGAGRLLAPRAAGAAAPGGGGRARAAVPLLVALLVGWNAVEAERIAPYDLAYFNAAAGGPENGHLWLLDSNLDWGQSAKALLRYVRARDLPMIYVAFTGNSDPWYEGVRYQYAPGSGNLEVSKTRPARVPAGLPHELFAVNAMVLHSLQFSDPHLYDWLLERRPVATPGYATFVFDITRDAGAHAQIARLCYAFRLPDLAEFEAHRALAYDPAEPLARAVLDRIAADASGAPGP